MITAEGKSASLIARRAREPKSQISKQYKLKDITHRNALFEEFPLRPWKVSQLNFNGPNGQRMVHTSEGARLTLAMDVPVCVGSMWAHCERRDQ